eukprot:COSAG04_NODE_15392_length_533_cov_0.976959_1_plen_67_part_10
MRAAGTATAAWLCAASLAGFVCSAPPTPPPPPTFPCPCDNEDLCTPPSPQPPPRDEVVAFTSWIFGS